MLAIKTTIFVMFVIFTAFIGVSYLILLLTGDSLSYDIGAFRWLGIAPMPFGIGMLIDMAYLLTHYGKGTPAPFEPTKELVIKGPYRIVRNPGYIAAVIALLGESAVVQSFVLTMYALVMWLFFHPFVVFVEEPG